MISAGYVIRRVGLCVAVMACAVVCMVSCGPKHEEFRPQLEVLLPSGVSLADGSVNYDAGGGATDFVVRSNGGWSITGGASWLEISPSSGTGDGAVRISAAAAESSRSAVVEVSMTQAPQVRISFNVVQRVEKTEPEDPDEPDDPLQGIIYRDSFDGAEARAEYGPTGDAWPTLAEIPGCAVFEGRGSDGVRYGADGVSVRSDMASVPDGYAGASGCNNLLFGGGAMMQVSGVALNAADADLHLALGLWTDSGRTAVGEDVEKPLSVWISGDGERWSRIEYADDTAAEGWRGASCDFSLAAVPESLCVAFVCGADAVVRIDDVSLGVGDGGNVVDLDRGGEIDREEPSVDPPSEREVTVAELVSMMPAAEGRVVADADSDLWFDAVVQTDRRGGNCAAPVLCLAAENAVEAGCGVSLAGPGVEAAAAGLVLGERVRVRLLRGAAMLCNEGGVLGITGEGSAPWFEVTSDGSVADVAVAVVGVRDLVRYQNMTVAVLGVESGGEGVWCGDSDGEHLFRVSGETLHVFVRGGAADFMGRRYGEASGEIRGVVTMRGGAAWLCPRNAADVAAFEPVAPPEPIPVTIPELIAMMPSDGRPAVIDAECDRVLTAVVMNDVDGGNCHASHLVLATPGATEAGNGITLYGACVRPSVLGVKRGDKVAVTLRASAAVVVNYQGMYEVTGDASTEWAEVEILESGCAIPTVTIPASQLAACQGMAVRVENAVPRRDGLWYDGVLGGDVLFDTYDGTLTVRTLAAAAFAGQRFSAESGDIAGLAAVSGGKAVLMPRNGEDVADFACTEEPTDPDNPSVEEPEEPEDPTDPETPPVEEPDTGAGYEMVTSLSALRAGRYHIGGYQNGSLYLATGGLTKVNHCMTSEFLFTDGKLTPLGAEAAVVTLESAGVGNGYYLHFEGDGYLSATGSGAGKLRFTESPAEYWIVTENPSGGFDMLLSGDKFVRMVVSRTAREALLRSVAADEQGNAIVLIRIGRQE